MLQAEINFISLSQSDSALPDDKGWTGGEGIFRFPPQLWRQFLDDLRRCPGYVASAAALHLNCHLLTTRLKQHKQLQTEYRSKHIGGVYFICVNYILQGRFQALFSAV